MRLKPLFSVVALSIILALSPASSLERLGSVISSFQVKAGGWTVTGVARDPAYAQAIVRANVTSYFYRYTPAGSFLGSYLLNPGVDCRDGDQCHLGAGYLAVVDNVAQRVGFYTLTGSYAGYFMTGDVHPAHVAWDGTYYYVKDYTGGGSMWRYTSGGSLVGSWTPPGWPPSMPNIGGLACLASFNNAGGSYLVATAAASNLCAVLTLPAGSLVATFTMGAPGSAGVCGGAPSDAVHYGEVLWLQTSGWVFQLDVGNGVGNGVAAASFGRVKALFQ